MVEEMEISIDDRVLEKAPTLFARARIIRDVTVTRPSPDLDVHLKEIFSQWESITEQELDANPMIMAYQRLQAQLGPARTKMLPAVEGMLKRGVLKGKFPRVNSVVDAANVVSITHLVPIGLFDHDRIMGRIRLTLADAGDRFVPIGKDKPIQLSEGTPVLRDSEGIFSAVGSRDAKRTMIKHETKNVLAFSWGAEGVGPDLISLVLDACAREIME